MAEESGQAGGLADTATRYLKPVLRVLCLLVIVLAVAGAATSSQPATAQGLFIAILFFSCLAAFLVIMCRVLNSSGGRSKYQINEKPGKGGQAAGQVNAGYDEEKAGSRVEGGAPEPWMNNYVPYGKNPCGGPIDQVTFTKEDNKEGEKEESVIKTEGNENTKEGNKWKENYVAYEENLEEEEDEEIDAIKEEKKDEDDEKDVDEKEVVEEKEEKMEKL